MNTKHVRLIFFVFVLTALVAGLVPMATAAEAPSINVAPVWPATTLTSLDENGTAFPTWDTDDDYRYVSAELYVTTTVEFWAMDMACTVDSRYLTSYVWDDTNATGDWGDDQQPIWWNDSVWNGNNGSYVAYEPAPTFNALANTMTVKATVSREGNQANAIGRNGQQTTLQLGALTFLVTETAGQSPLNCSFTFLDRDGNAVLRRSGYTAPPPLTTTEGFIVEGHATHQVHTRTNGIGVTCQVDGDPGTQETTTTDRNGYYKLPPIREEGHLDCWYEGNVTVPNADLYITRDINMSMSDRHSYYFLPVELLSGNLDNVNECGALGWYHQCVDDWDIQKVTTNWELNNNGDANGDGLTNKADLAIVAGNYYIHETWSVNHALYSLARSFTDTAMDNRVWVGDNNSGPVSQLVPPGRGTRDFWATMSPDGRTVAFVRASTPRGATYPNYEL
ncbi:MAG: hypothetical protein JW966_12360, partial [Anaerolineae bacterium]|nr:hypothetical protein [Anaerolineae bacterium]